MISAHDPIPSPSPDLIQAPYLQMASRTSRQEAHEGEDVMGKRSSFERRPMDDYATVDPAAVRPLIPHLYTNVETFAEPCAGDGFLVRHLEGYGLRCVYEGDIRDGRDALTVEWEPADAIITNPPWTREILHPMIRRFQSIAPTWLLFDADWAHTRQASPYLPQCSHIVSVGRIKWIPGSKHTGKDNCAWYRFDAGHEGGPVFVPRLLEAA